MSNVPCLTGSATDIKAFLHQYDTLLLDCDGKQVIFVTNNSTKSRGDHRQHFQTLGIPCLENQIFTSAYSTAVYISQILRPPPPRNKVFVLGEEGIEAELAAEGIEYIGGSDVAFQKDMRSSDFSTIASGEAIDDRIGVVVVGMDMKVNYLKLCHAAHYIQRGAVFLATNTDSTYPTHGTVFPGAGCISAALTPMVRQQPLSLGKPSKAMITAIQSQYSLNLKRTCIIGDRLDTDIRLGIDGGLGGTLLVLSGVSKREDLEAADSISLPGAYIGKLADLLL
ncbi:4-nitrophenylphosphatase [Hyphodiscus hymeniophilus]|uniref:4-nitrophenylphosphatase n=1 Tax=Hyphodiscus hymeniophilus TaxID=353542 RepID=A0A9P7AXV5_9HELO|nr:4-nitrophenylphosphatase [Hyphodiscus hymeniophilus]